MAWVVITDVTEIIGVSAEVFRSKYPAAVCRSAGAVRKVLLSSLPAAVQERYLADNPPPPEPAEPEVKADDVQEPVKDNGTIPTISDVGAKVIELDEEFLEIYNRAPDYNRKAYDKYYPVVVDCENRSGAEIEEYVANYNQTRPDSPITVPTVYRKLQAWRNGGKVELLGKFGKRRNLTSVPDDLMGIYEAAYSQNNVITAKKAYKATVGIAHKLGYDKNNLPGAGAFHRRYKNTVSKAVDCLRREGPSAYNRKHAPFIPRNYDKLLSGECWVSDHVQLDLKCSFGARKNAVRPWLTWWMDMKSGMIVGWHLHPDASNADDIFTAIYDAIANFGAPSVVYIDNGKDYRCNDLAGGRDGRGARHLSFMAELKIKVQFALPYNAQSKTIERTQQELNASFSVFFNTYCGNNSLNKPEDHNDTLASGDIWTFEQVNELLAKHITTLNRRKFTSGHGEGKTPEEIWAAEYRDAANRGLVKAVPESQLKLLCYRTSKTMSVVHGLIYDSELRCYYRHELLSQYDRRKVYLSRNHKAMETADVYDAVTNEFLISVELVKKPNAIAKTNVELVELKEASAQKKRQIKADKEAAARVFNITTEEFLEGESIYNDLESGGGIKDLPNAHNTELVAQLTSKAHVLRKKAELEKEGEQDLSVYRYDLDSPASASPIYITDSEIEEAAAAGEPEAIAILERRKKAV